MDTRHSRLAAAPALGKNPSWSRPRADRSIRGLYATRARTAARHHSNGVCTPSRDDGDLARAPVWKLQNALPVSGR